MKHTPLALPGFCRTNTSPASDTRCPWPMWIRLWVLANPCAFKELRKKLIGCALSDSRSVW